MSRRGAQSDGQLVDGAQRAADGGGSRLRDVQRHLVHVGGGVRSGWRWEPSLRCRVHRHRGDADRNARQQPAGEHLFTAASCEETPAARGSKPGWRPDRRVQCLSLCVCRSSVSPFPSVRLSASTSAKVRPKAMADHARIHGSAAAAMVRRRPMLSASGPATSAPSIAPTLTIEPKSAACDDATAPSASRCDSRTAPNGPLAPTSIGSCAGDVKPSV